MGIIDRIDNGDISPAAKTRYDVILSAAIEEDFLMGMERRIPGFRYTKMSDVTGRGFSVPKLGDAIWPQLNSAFVLFCDETEGAAVLDVMKELREHYLGEGLACWRSTAVEL